MSQGAEFISTPLRNQRALLRSAVIRRLSRKAEARWVASEDINIEYLLDVFTTIDGNSGNVWDICSYFLEHLGEHKPRPVVLGPKVEGLPDDHPSKPRCLFQLATLLRSVGKYAECKSFLTHTLKLGRKRGDDFEVVRALVALSDADRVLGLHKEGIQRAEEALEICEQLNDAFGLAHSFRALAWSLLYDNQLDAAEGAASRAIEFLPDEGDRSLVCECHDLLGDIYKLKGETEKAIAHFEVALDIASSFGWHDRQFWICYSLVYLFAQQSRFDDAQAHLERAKPHAAHSAYLLGCAARLQAELWHVRGRFEEAKSAALRAVDLYEKIGATKDLEKCREFIMDIDAEMKSLMNRTSTSMVSSW